MKKLISIVMCFVLLCLTAGCANKTSMSGSGDTLTYWVEFNDQASSGLDSMGEFPQYKYIQEKMGINIEFKHPVMGQAKEQLNLMLSSQDLTDIISYPFADSYPGGAEKAIKDGVIIPLDLDKAPNLKKYLSENPDVDKEVKLDDGTYYCFPAILEEKSMAYFYGAFMREDILKELGLEKPETIDDWYNVLTAMKNELGIESPLIMAFDQLVGQFGAAFDVERGLGVVDGEVKYMLTDGDVKGFLSTMRKWYKEGLIDKNIASVDGQMIKSYMIKGTAAATSGTMGGNLGAWQTIFNEGNGGEVLTPVCMAKNNNGEAKTYTYKSRYNSFGSACISSKCKNIDLAYKLLDYGYSEEGRLLYNFGIEGESYEMIDGYPTYTELVTKNPDGKSMSQMINYYGSPNGSHPRIQDKRYYEQFQALPQQKEAIKLWYDENAKDYSMPRVTLTQEEADAIKGIENDLLTYADAYMLKVITGVESLDSYDEYIATMKKRGVDKLVQIYQQAYDRYLER